MDWLSLFEWLLLIVVAFAVVAAIAALVFLGLVGRYGMKKYEGPLESTKKPRERRG
jgi:hypothetical protein